MTENEKKRITTMRAKGIGYQAIANALNLSVNTIKSYIRRASKITALDMTVCLNCGIEIEQSEHRKEKKFCSDKCRMQYWNRNPNPLRATEVKCLCCGKKVLSYRNPPRKYCSKECAGKGRRNETKHP